jgi:hypothetical protein
VVCGAPSGSVVTEKHFQEMSAELQIPPLRYATVGMTKGRVTLPFRFDAADDEQQVPPLRCGRDDTSVWALRFERENSG